MGLRDDLRGALSVFDGQVLPKDTKRREEMERKS
ncbi:hypothetical protein SMACR_02790 [Sordaria macrospora]|nr:hypothetical protein SMACR_02790 [Sordaria macrospora]